MVFVSSSSTFFRTSSSASSRTSSSALLVSTHQDRPRTQQNNSDFRWSFPRAWGMQPNPFCSACGDVYRIFYTPCDALLLEGADELLDALETLNTAFVTSFHTPSLIFHHNKILSHQCFVCKLLSPCFVAIKTLAQGELEPAPSSDPAGTLYFITPPPLFG